MSSIPSPDAPVPRRELYTVLAGLMLALALAGLDQNIVSTALPRIVSDLGGLSHLSWVVTAFMVSSTASTPLYGKLSDMYGRKPLFYMAISVFLVGSVLCGLAETMFQLIAFRTIQGLGAGGLFTLAQATMADLIAPRERGRFQGLFGAVFAACSVAGPLLGGVITDLLSWRWIFYVNLPVGAAALFLISIGLRHHGKKVEHRIDYTGAALLTAATVMLLLFLSWGGVTYPWLSPMMVGLAVTAAILYGLLVLQEHRAPEPILPPRLFVNRAFVIALTAVGLNSMALIGSLVFLPLFFQVVIGASPSHAGLMLAPLMGGVIVAAVIGGRLVSYTGRYKIFPIIGLAFGVAAFLCLSWISLNGSSIPGIEASLVMLGCGLGLAMPVLSVAMQNVVAPTDLGVATSVFVFMRSLGGALGVAVAGAVVAAQLRNMLPLEWMQAGSPEHNLLLMGVQQIKQLAPEQHTILLHAYRHAIATTFLTGAGVSALAFVFALFLPEHPLRSSKVEREEEVEAAGM